MSHLDFDIVSDFCIRISSLLALCIENQTLAHFRHFSSLYTNLPTLCLCASAPLNQPVQRIITYSQIHLFMQNKANFGNDKMNITIVITNNYKKLSRWLRPKNKANSNPIKPKTNPIQTQFNPIQSQNKPNLTYLKYELVFHLTYGSRLLNWIKSWQLPKNVQNWPYQYKNQLFMTVSEREEILSCQLTVVHFSKAH